MAYNSPEGKVLGTRVAEAREALKQKALHIVELMEKNIAMAMASGDFETANKALTWLLEHLPAAEGVRVVDVSVDKPVEVKGKSGPMINIGFALGGVKAQAELPPASDVIDIPTEKKDESTSNNDN